jgi:hypothetical protein
MLFSDADSREIDTLARHAAIARPISNGLHEPLLCSVPRARRSQTCWTGTLLRMMIFAAGVLALATIPVPEAREPQEPGVASSPGAGIIVRSERIRLWMPRTLIELGQRQPGRRVINSHTELRRTLECENLKHLWYAVTMRAHQANGEFVDITLTRQPYAAADSFAELQDILAATQNAASDAGPDSRSSRVSIHIIPQEYEKRAPLEVMAQMLSQPWTSATLTVGTALESRRTPSRGDVHPDQAGGAQTHRSHRRQLVGSEPPDATEHRQDAERH